MKAFLLTFFHKSLANIFYLLAQDKLVNIYFFSVKSIFLKTISFFREIDVFFQNLFQDHLQHLYVH